MTTTRVIARRAAPKGEPTLVRAKPHCAKPRSHRARVLCIDDDPEVSQIIELRLRDANMEVFRAFHGMQGIWTAIQKKPDAIILDLQMDKMDGFEVLDAIRGNSDIAFMPIVVLTGCRGNGLRDRLLRRGADDVLFKPVPMQRLIRSVSWFIRPH